MVINFYVLTTEIGSGLPANILIFFNWALFAISYSNEPNEALCNNLLCSSSFLVGKTMNKLKNTSLKMQRGIRG